MQPAIKATITYLLIGLWLRLCKLQLHCSLFTHIFTKNLLTLYFSLSLGPLEVGPRFIKLPELPVLATPLPPAKFPAGIVSCELCRGQRSVCCSLQSLMWRYDASYVADMNFLGAHVWPRVKSVAYCHDSFSCDRFPAAHAFPVKRKGAEHVGGVYNELSVGPQIDFNILNRAPVNRKCVPPG